MKRSQEWKQLERDVAKLLGGKRIIRYDYSEITPDVKLKDFPTLKIDTKRYKKFRIFSMWRKVKEKYCEPTDNAVLTIREGGKHNILAVIDIHLLAALLNYIRKEGKHVYSINYQPL